MFARVSRTYTKFPGIEFLVWLTAPTGHLHARQGREGRNESAALKEVYLKYGVNIGRVHHVEKKHASSLMSGVSSKQKMLLDTLMNVQALVSSHMVLPNQAKKFWIVEKNEFTMYHKMRRKWTVLTLKTSVPKMNSSSFPLSATLMKGELRVRAVGM